MRMVAGLWMVLGLVALVAGAELVVSHGSRLALRLRVPPILIGLTIVSLGTSAPELAVGIDAILKNAGDLAIGNIAGTNVVNILLILGLSAAIAPLALARQTLRTDLPAMVLASVLLLVLALDGSLSRLDGVILITVAVAYTWLLIHQATRPGVRPEKPADVEPVAAEAPDRRRHTLFTLAMLVVGIAIIVLGADWLVRGAVSMAQQLGVTDALIGLTIVAIGTSAPELVTTIVSTIKGNRDIAIGNLIGSSTYNIAFVLGASLLFAPSPVPLTADLMRLGLPVMVLVALVCIPVFLTGRKVSRPEGIVFVAAYLGYLSYLIATG